jgi:hypothetical protein
LRRRRGSLMSMDAASALPLPNAQPLLDSAGRQGHRLSDTAEDSARTVADYFSRQQVPAPCPPGQLGSDAHRSSSTCVHRRLAGVLCIGPIKRRRATVHRAPYDPRRPTPTPARASRKVAKAPSAHPHGGCEHRSVRLLASTRHGPPAHGVPACITSRTAQPTLSCCCLVQRSVEPDTPSRWPGDHAGVLRHSVRYLAHVQRLQPLHGRHPAQLAGTRQPHAVPPLARQLQRLLHCRTTVVAVGGR